MKNIFLIVTCFFLSSMCADAQKKTKEAYPVPEYSNEVCLLKKDSVASIVRLEKGSSKQEMKVKLMGMGGMDQGYTLEEEKSTVRLNSGNNLVFVYYTGSTETKSTPEADSVMKANGMDPKLFASNPMSAMMDPTQTISLYSMKSDKGKRKILLQSMGVMGKSKKAATKYTLSVKKIKDNYYELLVDKTSLPKGEYAFVMMDMGSMDQSWTLFSFGVD